MQAGASIVTNGQVLYATPGGGGNDSRVFWKYVPGGAVFRPAPISRNVGALDAGTVNVDDASFAIAPNPLASGFATLSYSLPKAGAAEVSVYNVSGQTVLSWTLSVGREGSGVDLDLRHLSNGVYVVKLRSDGFAGTQKLVVRR